jgi:hypothetical protein
VWMRMENEESVGSMDEGGGEGKKGSVDEGGGEQKGRWVGKRRNAACRRGWR